MVIWHFGEGTVIRCGQCRRASVLGEGVEVEAVERNQNDLSGFIEILTVDLQLAQDLRE
jgi:hypothetical protein